MIPTARCAACTRPSPSWSRPHGLVSSTGPTSPSSTDGPCRRTEAEAAWRALEGFVAGWELTVDAVDVVELVEPRWRLVERHPLRLATAG